MDNQNKETKNTGVICSVKHCAYHDGANCCTAKKISVGPSSATCCSETVCATYKARDIG